MVGDAAHPMSPFQGQGANMALMGAVGLARVLAIPGPGQDREAAALDADLVKRGRKAVLESRSNSRRFYESSAWGRFQRDLAFRTANVFIRIFSSRK